jgi:hypothetical protein
LLYIGTCEAVRALNLIDGKHHLAVLGDGGSGTRHPATMAEETGLSIRVSHTTDRYTGHEDDRRRSHESHISEHETVEVVAESLEEHKDQNGMHIPKRVTDEIKVLANVGHKWKRTSATDGKFSKIPFLTTRVWTQRPVSQFRVPPAHKLRQTHVPGLSDTGSTTRFERTRHQH